MNALKFIRTFLTLPALMVVSLPLQAQNPDQPSTSIQPTPAERDGQHDFDFEIGTWKTHLRRLLHPLSGSTTWAEYEGTTFVRKVWNGRANLLVLEVDGPKGHIEALSLRLYNPQSHQWSLNFANSSGGTLSQPTIGGFKDGRGEFSTRKCCMVAPFLFDLSSPTSLQIRRTLSSHSPTMEARLGK